MKWNELKDSKKIWYEVAFYTFSKLRNFTLEVLILPCSNATVERLFSKLNLYYIKWGLIRVNKCCVDYNVPTEILDKIKTIEVYEKTEFIAFIVKKLQILFYFHFSQHITSVS